MSRAPHVFTPRDQHLDGHPAPWSETLWAAGALVLAVMLWGVVLALFGA